MLIAEIGQNHCGNMNLALELIDLAQENGADLCKFQLYSHEALYKDHPEIPNVELSFDQAKMLFDYGQNVGIEVFFSVFDVERVKWCEEIRVKRYKLPCLFANPQVNMAVYNTQKPYIQSLSSVWASIEWSPPRNMLALFCPRGYPQTNLNLGGMFGRHKFDGFSDHTIGLDAARVALAGGAQIIEKHFAKDHHTGVDAAWSMTPDELKELKRWESRCKEIL